MAKLVLEGDRPAAAPQCRASWTKPGLAALRAVSVSQGIMLETASERLSRARRSALRLARQGARRAARHAGGRRRPRVPFTTGILIGIGETRARAHRGAAGAPRPARHATATSRRSSSRISAPSPARAWRGAPEPSLDEHLWTIAVARLMLRARHEHPGAAEPAAAATSAPLMRAGINDWGGVSPVTPDHVNPEAPWPHLAALGAGDRRGRPHARRAAGDLPALRAASRRAGSTPELRTPVLHKRRRRRAARARTTGRRATLRARCRPASSPTCARRAPATMRIAERCAIAGQATRAQRPGRGRHRRAVRGARRRFRGGLPRRPTTLRRHACGDDGHLRRQPQHQLHQHLHLPLQVLRVLEGPAQRRACATSPTTSSWTRSPSARARPGSAAPPRSACRAASTRATPAQTYLGIVEAVKIGCARHARPRLLAARGLARRRRRSGCRCRDYLARLKDAGLGDAARHGGGDPRRRGARRPLPRQAQHRRSGSR